MQAGLVLPIVEGVLLSWPASSVVLPERWFSLRFQLTNESILHGSLKQVSPPLTVILGLHLLGIRLRVGAIKQLVVWLVGVAGGGGGTFALVLENFIQKLWLVLSNWLSKILGALQLVWTHAPVKICWRNPFFSAGTLSN